MIGPEQRQALLGAKLRALVAEHQVPRSPRLPLASASPVDEASQHDVVVRPFPAGAAVTIGTAGWCLVAPSAAERDPLDRPDDGVDDINPRGWLGGAIVWATRHAVSSLDVVADHLAPGDGRRAALFSCVPGLDRPPTIWRVSGRSLDRVAAEPFPDLGSLDAVTELFRDSILEAGADPVVEHGVLRAEYLGLELGRVVVGEDDVPRLDVGVGRHDRLANAMLGHDRDTVKALRDAIAAVAHYRRRGAPPHPANQLAPARWLRSLVVAEPVRVGIDVPVTPVAGTEPSGLKRPTPAIATGVGVVVACSVGTDLDAVAFAADARSMYQPDAELVLVVPEHDALPSQRTLVASVPNARLVTVSNNWRDDGVDAQNSLS